MSIRGGDKVAEHVVGVRLGYAVGGVCVGVGGEEIAAGGVGERLDGRDVCCPDWSRQAGGSTSRRHASESVVGIDGRLAVGPRGKDKTVHGTADDR